jgi:Ca2+-transporting ATPase
MPESESQMRSYAVDGHSYMPVGAVRGLEANWSPDSALTTFCKTGAYCNESRLDTNGDGRYQRTGEPTEAAVRVLVEKLGCPDQQTHERCYQRNARSKADAMAFTNYWMRGITKRATLEFSRDRKTMSVLCANDEWGGSCSLYVKGAPENILERCTTIMLPWSCRNADGKWQSCHSGDNDRHGS